MPIRENSRQRRIGRSGLRSGAIAVMFAVCLPLVLIVAAFAINVAYMHLARAELRVATDAAARAGARTLSITQSTADALAAAQQAASRNLVAGQPLHLELADIEFGLNRRGSSAVPWVFTPQSAGGPINAVRVTGRKLDGSASQSVPLFFGRVLQKQYYEPIRTSVAMQIDRDIVLVVDRSGSMGRLVGPGKTKWDALADAVDLFLDAVEKTVPEEKVALVWFDDQVGRAVELTGNYNAIRNAMSQLEPRGWTAIGMGLEQGVASLLNSTTARPFAQKTVVLMTDGRHNTGQRPDSVATRELGSHDLLIQTITFGNDADQQLMEDVAQIGGGRHWHAVDQAQLAAAYVEIANDIPTVLTQ